VCVIYIYYIDIDVDIARYAYIDDRGGVLARAKLAGGARVLAMPVDTRKGQIFARV